MLMLGVNEAIGQMVMANSAGRYGHVLRREDGDVLRKSLDFEVEDQRKIGRRKRTWKKQVEEESMNVAVKSGVLVLITSIVG